MKTQLIMTRYLLLQDTNSRIHCRHSRQKCRNDFRQIHRQGKPRMTKAGAKEYLPANVFLQQ